MVPEKQPPSAVDQIVIRYLDSFGNDDPERAHGDADDVLLALVHPEVASAYRRLMVRCPWWAAS